MIIIGINGHNGAGKTTFSNMLFSNSNKKVVSLDYLFDNLKNGLFKNYSTSLEKTNGEKAIYLSNDTKLQHLISKKSIEPLYFKMKSILANLLVNKIINESKDNNIDYLKCNDKGIYETSNFLISQVDKNIEIQYSK